VTEPTLLLLGVYGLEIVECGGVLAKNARAGGTSFASIMLARPQTRPQIESAAAELGVKTHFLDFEYGDVRADVPSKQQLIRVIREVRPHLIITQDPEHAQHDLDPDRRPAMTLILESIALAARDIFVDELASLPPHPIPTLYYMTPHEPNCVVDISDVWDLKERAMDKLESQMRFSGKLFPKYYSEEHLRFLVPTWDNLPDDYTRGREVHRQLDRVTHLHNGLGGHGRFAVAESYRREGKFHLQQLLP
jgi:hypothetical protein